MEVAVPVASPVSSRMEGAMPERCARMVLMRPASPPVMVRANCTWRKSWCIARVVRRVSSCGTSTVANPPKSTSGCASAAMVAVPPLMLTPAGVL